MSNPIHTPPNRPLNISHWRENDAKFSASRLSCALATAGALAMTSAPAVANGIDGSMIEKAHPSHVEHVDQHELLALKAKDPHEAFITAFDMGDELFEVEFLIQDGGGANVGNGHRTTRMPRADLKEWSSHFPKRSTGPNGMSCVECHARPVADGAGGTAMNVHRDPHHTGSIGSMIQRNTPHLHGSGGIQRVAEEMTDELMAIRDEAVSSASSAGKTVTRDLTTKGVNFGKIMASADGTIDYKGVRGVDDDLIVRPFQWKGNFATVRDFNNDAMHNELGVQPVEIVGDGKDGDMDGVVDEATVGDMTALTIYLAAQPRPTTRVELGEHGLGPVVSPEEIAQIDKGEKAFMAAGCGGCHMPEMRIETPIFSEPSLNPHYRLDTFAGGQDAVKSGVDPANPISFDLTADQPDNQVHDSAGNMVAHLGALERDGDAAIIRLFGDLKRHKMGPGLAEDIDETGHGADVFMTENLWGVGVTAPYLHDGRATTLTEAILWHGGDAEKSRMRFEALSADDQTAVVAFLNNMVIFLPDEEEEE